MKNPTNKMSRTEVLTALAAYAHPTWYHSLTEWDDPELKALLSYYEHGGTCPSVTFKRLYRTKGLGDTERQGVCFIELDFAYEERTLFSRIFSRA